MKIAQLFRNGRNQALRIPKEFEFQNVKSVKIERDGDNLILIPQHEFTWKSWWSQWSADENFMPEGRQQEAIPSQSIFE